MPHKSEAMAALCKQYDWETEIVPFLTGAQTEIGNSYVDEIGYKLYALRGHETICVEYHGRKMITATYTYGTARKLTLYWKNQVVKLIKDIPDPKKLTVSKIESSVPWDEISSDDFILNHVKGRIISWERSIDGQVVSARVAKIAKISRPRSNPGKRNLEWVDEFGFRSAPVNAILSVG